MKILRKTLAMVTALMMICGCVTAHAADVTTPQKISSDTVLDVDGGIIITDVTDEFALDIDGNSSGEIKAEVAVSEDITARETGAGGSFTGAVNIETGYESTAGVEAGRDLIATSVSDGVQVTGLAINTGEASAVNIGAGNGDLVVTAKGDDAPAIGMEITTGHSASADVNIGAEGGGGISVETAGVNSLAAGVRLLSGKESSIDVTVGDGGILSSAAAGEATGLEAEAEGKGAAIVSVGKGGISAQTEGDSYNVQGVYASASEMGKVSIESKEGDVSAVAGGEAEARGIGVHASDDSGVAVMVQNVSAEAPKGTQAFGVSVGTYGDDPLAYVDVAGDVSVVGSENESESKAVEIENEGGTVMMNVDGDINAKEARGISIINDTNVSGAAGSLTQMKVGGDIVSQNSGYNVAVHMGTGSGDNRIEADYNGSVIATGDAGTGVSMSGEGGTITATVGKDISVDMKDNAMGVDTEYDNLEESLTVLGSIDVNSANDDACGINTMGGGTGTQTFTVSGDVSVNAPKGTAYGVSVDAASGSSELDITIKGNLSVKGVDDPGHCSSGASFYNGGSKVSLDVGGDIGAVNGDGIEITNQGESASSTVTVGGNIEVEGAQPNVGIRIENMGDNALAYVDVSGDVSVVGSENDSVSAAVNIDNDGGTVMMNVDGDVNAEEARGVSIINNTIVSGTDSSLTQMKVGGDVVSQDSGYNVGVHMGTGSGDNRIEADYNGSVIVTGDAGIGVEMSGDGGTIEATVGKDISEDMKDNAVGVDTEYDNDMEESLTVLGSIDVNSANDDACGIKAMGGGTGTQTFTVSGDVSVNAPKGTAYGVNVDAASGSSELGVSIKGNLSVKGVDDPGHCSSGAMIYNNGSKVNLDVGGDNSAVNGDGIEIENMGESASSTVTVGGNIEVEGAQPNVGIRINNMGDNALARVDVGGGISVNNDNHARGIAIDASSGDVEVNVGNEVTAVAKYDDAEAIDLYTNTDAVVSVTAAGPVTAITEDEAGAAIGIHVNPSSGAGKVYVSAKDGVSAENTAGGSATAIRVEHMHVLPAGTLKDESVVDVYVQGDVTSTGTGIYVQTEEEGEGSVHVLVDEGNVEADSTGIFLMGNQTMDVLVDGTVHGGNSSVLVEGTVSDMTLTVWEIKPDDEGHYVERVDWLPEDPGPSTWEDEELCKEIQYIIRVQPNDHATLTAEGTTDYEGYQVAHEDDKVVLKIDIQPGYQLEGAFGNADQNIELKRDDEGNYYLVVPRGGGVLLGVKLSKILPAKKKLTVTFDPNSGVLRGSTEPFTTSVEKDGTLTLPEAPEKDGSVFLGWYGTPFSAQDPRWSAPEAGSDELKPAGAEVTVTDTVFYTAVWQANE